MPKKQANKVDAHVGHQVRTVRLLRGVSQEALGEKLGLTFQQVQKYEKGVNRIGAGRLYDIAGILGVEVVRFYEGLNGTKVTEEVPARLSDDAVRVALKFEALDLRSRRMIYAAMLAAKMEGP
jgi:transcriptional regulator with XRE-family HTH domain